MKYWTDLGRILAKEQPVAAESSCRCRDSGVCAAMGFAEQSGVPLSMASSAIITWAATFIQPRRRFGIRLKSSSIRCGASSTAGG